MGDNCYTREREILPLKERCLCLLSRQYGSILQGRTSSLTAFLPFNVKVDLFQRLLARGVFDTPLLESIPTRNNDNKLKSIMDLRQCEEGLKDDGCRVIGKFRELQVLFAENVGATPESLSQMFLNLRNLTNLELKRTSNFNDSVMKALVKSCPSLSILNVMKTKVTDEGIVELGKGPQSLEALDISYCHIGILGFTAMLEGNSKGTLKELKFIETDLKKKEDILKVVGGFDKLDMYSCSFATFDDMSWVTTNSSRPPPSDFFFQVQAF